jgi:hypothetical protein
VASHHARRRLRACHPAEEDEEEQPEVDLAWEEQAYHQFLVRTGLKDITPDQIARRYWLGAAADSFGLTDAEAAKLVQLEQLTNQ